MTQKNLSLLELADAWTLIDECLENCAKRGDTRLAELIQASVGVCIAREALKEEKETFPSEVHKDTRFLEYGDKYESAVDVAIRLGFEVPSPYEGALGATVVKSCRHLRLPKKTRYSTALHQPVSCNLYPADNFHVTRAVYNYCINQGFK